MDTKTISKTDAIAHEIAEAFIRWPLPESVCSDLCATRQGSGRVGTNLLSCIEAREMARDVVLPIMDRETAQIRAVVEAQAKSLRRWGAEAFPADANGQVHFARVLMEGVADELEAVFATPAEEPQHGAVLVPTEGLCPRDCSPCESAGAGTNCCAESQP